MCKPARDGSACIGAAVFGDAGRGADGAGVTDAVASPWDFGSGVFIVAGSGFGAGLVTDAGLGVVLATGSLLVRANSFCSGVFFQRQANCARPAPVMPSVRRNAHAPQATRIAATSATRRAPTPSERLTTAQTTSARQRPGMT